MKPSLDPKFPFDLSRLVETRLLVQANSGGGKSWVVRRLLEQTFGAVQHIVLDVEDEFHTLREKFDYVLAGKNGDCPADPRCAAQLAVKLLELNVSAIVSIYELKHHERVRFVKLFLDALVDSPRTLWHPALVVVDEAHQFCPQHGEAESGSAVIELMSRGRKRGFCGVLCTQRISKLHKDAAAEANNKLIGRAAQDIDMKRAADELGFTTKEQQNGLRAMNPGSFFAFGPALSTTVTLINVGPVQTTHPKIGERSLVPTPPREKVRKVLEKLADLPAQVEQERQTLASLQARVRELEAAARNTRAPDPGAIAAAEARGAGAAATQFNARISELTGKLTKIVAIADVGSTRAVTFPATKLESKPAKLESKPEAPRRELPSNPGNAAAVKLLETLSRCERAILTVLAQLGACSKNKVAITSGYSVTSGSFRNSLGSLRSANYITGSDVLTITAGGSVALGGFDPLPIGAALIDHWLRELGKCESEILRVLTDAYPQQLTKEQIAQQTSYSATSGSFRNSLGKLRTLELIKGYSDIAAADELMGVLS